MGIREALQEEIRRLEGKAAKLREALAVVESADGVSVGNGRKGRKGRKKGSKMSEAARKRIGAAKSKWWADKKAKSAQKAKRSGKVKASKPAASKTAEKASASAGTA